MFGIPTDQERKKNVNIPMIIIRFQANTNNIGQCICETKIHYTNIVLLIESGFNKQ